MRRLLGLASLGLAARALETRQQVTPVQKVVQLLEGMVSKAKEEKHEEQVQYAAFEQFCTDVTSEKTQTLSKLEEQQTLLSAQLTKAETEAERLAKEIEGHNEEIASITADSEAAAEVRKSEETDYLAMRQNYTESVSAIAKALNVLKSQNYERPGEMPSALLQELPSAAAAALLQEEPDLTFMPDVPTTAYAPKSGEVVTMLENLQGKFRRKLEELDKEEAKRKHASDMLQQDLTGAKAAAEAAIQSKTESKAKHLEEAVTLKADLQELAKQIDETKTYLTDLTALCAQKADEYKSRQGMREEEIAALGKAIEIMKGSDVGAAAERRNTAPAAAGTALVQLRGDAGAPLGSQARAAAFLLGESSRLDSRVLSGIAEQLRSDPLAKVKTLIEELIERLKMEALRESEHKGWCDKELATNAHTRKTKTQEVEALRIDIDSLEGAILELKKDQAELSVSIKETTEAMANATQLRAAEKAENEAAIDDAQKGQLAVGDAVKILQDFYAKAASQKKSFAQVQRAAQEPPPIFEDGTYTGQQAESGGVLAMLDVIKSDFARIEADAKAAETAAQQEHDKFMEESRTSMAQMESDVKHKSRAQQDNEASLQDKKDDLVKVEEILATAEAEYKKLGAACNAQGQTYEERVQMRKDEIEALKQAYAILSGEV